MTPVALQILVPARTAQPEGATDPLWLARAGPFRLRDRMARIPGQ